MTESSTQAPRRALVTGAASGIGKAIAKRLVRAGCEVIGVDRSPIEDEALTGPNFVVDLTSAQGRAELFDRVPTLDLLVNAAGVSITRALAQTSEADWDVTMEINAKVPFFLMQTLGFRMPEGGAIVNIASVAGKMATNVQGAPYNASKAAVLALTKTFAYALAGRGVRVNAICPGVTDTPMLDRIWAAESEIQSTSAELLVERYLERVPLGRLGLPDEIADTAAFLLSHDARYITGQSVNVCGGLVMS